MADDKHSQFVAYSYQNTCVHSVMRMPFFSFAVLQFSLAYAHAQGCLLEVLLETLQMNSKLARIHSKCVRSYPTSQCCSSAKHVIVRSAMHLIPQAVTEALLGTAMHFMLLCRAFYPTGCGGSPSSGGS